MQPGIEISTHFKFNEPCCHLHSTVALLDAHTLVTRYVDCGSMLLSFLQRLTGVSNSVINEVIQTLVTECVHLSADLGPLTLWNRSGYIRTTHWWKKRLLSWLGIAWIRQYTSKWVIFKLLRFYKAWRLRVGISLLPGHAVININYSSALIYSAFSHPVSMDSLFPLSFQFSTPNSEILIDIFYYFSFP